ncbi:uncharacterized protein LOC127720717 [Mytilus californianus]|uniref:uncharacterized protein LOC127720717 n=1 Tax=Mytilus californianus TaxID=6549 RepID=UPI002246D4C0|nr:uncharacterized protein LOC127720717 [Mytilus californianus]
MWILYFLVIGLLLVDFCENSKVYITHDIGGAIKHCKPIYNCPPGHEILPCVAEYTKDICTSCPLGLVQPDYIQSTMDTALTKCFKNKNVDKCRPEDLEPSRENSAKDCSSGADFCKCDTDKCYFGNPCACTYRECGLGETMLSNGTCLQCPAGTWKNESGCGPCFPSQVPVVSTQVTQIIITSTKTKSTQVTQRFFTSTKTKSRQYVTTRIEILPLTEREAIVTLVPSIGKTQSKGGITHGRAQTPNSIEKTSSNSLIAVVVVLAGFCSCLRSPFSCIVTKAQK